MHRCTATPARVVQSQLVKFAERVAGDVEALLAGDPLPVVLVGRRTQRTFQRASRLGAQLVGTVGTNPEVLTDAALHDAVRPLVQPRLDASRRGARDSFATTAAGRSWVAYLESAAGLEVRAGSRRSRSWRWPSPSA